MEVQKVNNKPMTNQKSFGMQVGSRVSSQLEIAIQRGGVSNKLASKIVAAAEKLKGMPQTDRYALSHIDIKGATSVSVGYGNRYTISKIGVHDTKTDVRKDISITFKFMIPRKLRKFTDAKYLDEIMAKEAKSQARQKEIETALINRSSALKTKIDRT